jgi:hypothetical protein
MSWLQKTLSLGFNFAATHTGTLWVGNGRGKLASSIEWLRMIVLCSSILTNCEHDLPKETDLEQRSFVSYVHESV